MSESLAKTVTETRKLAAIMFTDIVGFSRQMGSNEARMLRLLDIHNQVVQHAVADHHGTVIKVMGDVYRTSYYQSATALTLARTQNGKVKSRWEKKTGYSKG